MTTQDRFMALKLDHVILAVDDLRQATVTFQDLGFTVTAGGEHSGGTTHNALVIFKDGTYLELLAPTGKASAAGVVAPDFSRFLKSGLGFTGYALHTDDLQNERAMHGQNTQIGHMQTGGRVRPDGTRLSWWVAFLEDRLSPFYIQDRTARNLRVSSDPQYTHHANGIEGISSVGLLVSDVQAVVRHYWDITGIMFMPDGDSAEFYLQKHHFLLIHPDDPQTRDYLGGREEAIYRLELKSASGKRTLYAFRDGRIVV
jgi:catechol 2,3-dioxygenase-like lactoylglutathione lyase family enzyme